MINTGGRRVCKRRSAARIFSNTSRNGPSDAPKKNPASVSVFSTCSASAGRLPGLPRPPHHQRKHAWVKRLHQVIERAEPHGLDRALDFSLRCHDHHPGPLLRETRAQQVRAQAVGQMDVQQDKVKLQVRQQPLRAAERVGAGDIGAQRLQVGA